MAIVQDLGAWVDAGGDASRHEILSRAGRIATFTDDAYSVTIKGPSRTLTDSSGYLTRSTASWSCPP